MTTGSIRKDNDEPTELPMLDARTVDEVLAELEGIPIDQYRREVEDERILRERGEAFRNRPPDEWPALHFQWDLRPDAQRFALDGVKVADFAEHYPSGFVLGHVELAAFDAVLCHFNKRNDLVELWECGFAAKLCSVIAYVEAGRPLTPPLVGVANGELCFQGGNHRYTAAKFSGQTQLPIYVRPEDRAAVSALLDVDWTEKPRS